MKSKAEDSSSEEENDEPVRRVNTFRMVTSNSNTEHQEKLQKPKTVQFQNNNNLQQQKSIEDAKTRQQEALIKAREEALRLQAEAKARAEAARAEQVRQYRLQQQQSTQQDVTKKHGENETQKLKVQQENIKKEQEQNNANQKKNIQPQNQSQLNQQQKINSQLNQQQTKAQQSHVNELQSKTQQPQINQQQGKIQQPQLNQQSSKIQQPQLNQHQGKAQQQQLNQHQGKAQQPQLNQQLNKVQEQQLNQQQTKVQQPQLNQHQGKAQQQQLNQQQNKVQQPQLNQQQGKVQQPQLNQHQGKAQQQQLNQHQGEAQQQQLNQQQTKVQQPQLNQQQTKVQQPQLNQQKNKVQLPQVPQKPQKKNNNNPQTKQSEPAQIQKKDLEKNVQKTEIKESKKDGAIYGEHPPPILNHYSKIETQKDQPPFHNQLIEDTSWKLQRRVPQNDVQIISPEKIAIPDFIKPADSQPTVIVPTPKQSTRVQWNEFPEEEIKEQINVPRVRTKEWNPENEIEHVVQKTTYQPNRINRTWPPPEYNEGEEYEIGPGIKTKAIFDDEWIQSDEKIDETATNDKEKNSSWQKQIVSNGNVRNRVWPPPDNLIESLEISMGPKLNVNWPPVELKEKELQDVQNIQTHLPIKPQQRQWPPVLAQ